MKFTIDHVTLINAFIIKIEVLREADQIKISKKLDLFDPSWVHEDRIRISAFSGPPPVNLFRFEILVMSGSSDTFYNNFIIFL